jgi:hypothetical protein
MKATWNITAAAILALTLASCSAEEPAARAVFSLTDYEEQGLLAFMNDQQETTFERLDLDCAIRSDSARNIINTRDGRDGVPGTADDVLFKSAQEIDDVFMVGPWTMGRLYECAVSYGRISLEKAGLVNFMNDRAGTTFERLDVACGIRSDSARNLILHRDGPDGAPATEDDDPFDTPQEIEDVSMVGPWTMEKLTICAQTFGYVGATPSFEPQEEETSHETAQDLGMLQVELSDVIESLIQDATERYADHDVIFPVEFGQVEIIYSGSDAVRYRVDLYQWLDRECGVQLWIKYWLNAEFEVEDVIVYI